MTQCGKTVYCQSLMDKKLLFCGAFDQGKRGRGLYNLGYSLNERLLLLMVIGLGKLIELIQLDRFQQGLCLFDTNNVSVSRHYKFVTILVGILCKGHKDIWQVCSRYLKPVVWKEYLLVLHIYNCEL